MATLDQLLNSYVLPTGRRLIAHQAVAKAARAAGHTELVTHVDAALAHDTQTRALELRWARQRDGSPPPEEPTAAAFDAEADEILGGVHDVCTGMVSSRLEGQPIQEATLVLDTFFPSGLAGLTKLTHEEQATAVDSALKELESAEGQAALTTLRLTASVQRLSEVQRNLNNVLTKASSPTIQWKDVSAQQAKGHALMLQTVARVLGLHPSDSAADTAARAALLEGILKQQQDVRAQYRRRNTVVDLNPDTGLPDNPTPPPSPVPSPD